MSFHQRVLAWCLVGFVLSAVAGAGASDPPESPPMNESELPAAVEMADKLLIETESTAAAARRWLREQLSKESLARRRADVEQAVEKAWTDAVEVARVEYSRSLGTFLFEPAVDSSVEWRRIQPGDSLPSRAVLLVHGLDEAGTIWSDAAPTLHGAGHVVIRFDYPNDQAISLSADAMASSLRELRAGGVKRIDIVAHSMGGLVSRDVLTRPEFYGSRADGGDEFPTVGRLIMMGTPNQGSPLAPLRSAMEVREQLVRWIGSEGKDPRALLGFLVDGDGQAGFDLMPGSDFLKSLNERPPIEGLAITSIEGCIAAPGKLAIASSLRSQAVRKILGEDKADSLLSKSEQWINGLGDGAVPAASVRLDGITDVVLVDADHRSMIKRIDALENIFGLAGMGSDRPAAIPVILERLATEPATLR